MNTGNRPDIGLDLQENVQCNSEKYIVELAELSDEDVASNIELWIKSISDFCLQSNNEIYGTHVIRLAFIKLLPHLPFEEISEKIVQSSMEYLQKCIANSLTKMLEVSLENACYLECLITGIGTCDFLLSYIDSAKMEGSIDVENIKTVPITLIVIFSSIVKFLKENKAYCSHDLNDLRTQFTALLKESLELSVKISSFIKNIMWAKNDITLCLLADVCENICHVAQLLADLPAGVKASLEIWKAFASIIQTRPEDLGRQLCLNVPIGYLSKNIIDEMQSLSNFVIENSSDEKISSKMIKTAGFNLKILIRICQLYAGYLRGTHKNLLAMVLNIYRYRHSSENTKINFPKDLIVQFEQQITIGVEELISVLLSDKLFAREIGKLRSSFHSSENSNFEIIDTSGWGLNSENSSVNDSQAYLLVLYTTLIKQLLSNKNTNHIDLWEPILIDHICNVIAHCHVELCLPLELPGVMYDGHAQEDISMYAYTMIYVCGFMSIMNEDKYKNSEKVLFINLLSNNIWRSLFSMDVLCFIARYGKASMCEDYCRRLMMYLQSDYISYDRKRTGVTLLSRLLKFLAPETAENFLKQWIDDYQSYLLVVNVISQITFVLSEEFQFEADKLILESSYEKLTSWVNNDSGDYMKEVMTCLEMLILYCGSPAINKERTSEELMKSLASSIVRLFIRIPTSFLKCSLISKIFSLTIQAIVPFIKHLKTEDMFVVMSTCYELVKESSSFDVSLAVSNFVAALGGVEFTDTTYGKLTLGKLQEILAILISSSNVYIHQSIMEAMVTFGKNTIHEEVFSNCIELCSTEKQEAVTKFLQLIPYSLPEKLQLSTYLLCQQKCLLEPKIFSSSLVHIPSNKKRIIIDSEVFSSHKTNLEVGKHINIISDPEEKSIKRRKLIENNSTNSASTFTELMSNLTKVKSTLETENKNSFTLKERSIIIRAVEEILKISTTS